MKNIIDYTEAIKDYVNEAVESGGGGSSEYYIDQQVTLSTSSDTTVTFTDSKITANSVIDVYATDEALDYTAMTIAAGECTVTFPKQSSASTVSIRIYVK